jgi:hypothetical protein
MLTRFGQSKLPRAVDLGMALTDMEELIARVVRPEAKDFMSEALRCYHAGAFRACVVLSYIALFDDLRKKLAPLAIVNAAAKMIHQEIEKKAANQEVFETDLANQLLKAGLIDAGRKGKLDIIIGLRNKAAHPSGIHASPEEARFVFFEVIDKFLNESQLETTYAAQAIVAALPKGNYFPSNQIADIRNIVENDVASLSPQAIPFLIAKLVALREGGDPNAKLPASHFLIGLAALTKDDVRNALRKTVVIEKAVDKEYASLIVSLLRVDPKLADSLKAVERDRIVALLKSLIEEDQMSGKINRLGHPLGWFKAFVQVGGQSAVWADYGPVVEALLAKYLYDADLMSTVAAAGSIHDAYFKILEVRVSSSQFADANPAAKAIPTLDQTLGATLSVERAFRILAAVTRAAEHSAYEAKDLRDTHFIGAPTLRLNADNYAAASPIEAQRVLDEFHVIAPLHEVRKSLA